MTPHLSQARRILVTVLVAVLTAGLFVLVSPGADAAVTSAKVIKRGQSIGVGGTYTQLAAHGVNGKIQRVRVSPTGNVVLSDGGTAKWSSGTSGGSHVLLRVLKNGNIVVAKGTKVIKSWRRHDVSSLILTTTGYLAARNAAGAVVWKTKTHTTARVTTSAMSSTERTIANSVLNLLNSERAAHGRAKLTMNSTLLRSARSHNLAMAKANTLSHQLPGESAFNVRISNAGYRYSWAGENIGVHGLLTQAAALELERMMYAEGPNNGDGKEHGHYENIVRPEFTNVGVDIYLDKTHHALWLTQDFGRP